MAFWNRGRGTAGGRWAAGAESPRRARQALRLNYEPLEPRLALTGLVISELLASNSNGLADADGDQSDWIELYNPGAVAVDLAGWSLTDDAQAPTKWQFPDVTLDAGGYLVVFASGKDRAVAGQELHANFALSADGEYLGLVMPDGETVAYEYAPQFPPQWADISYGLADVATVDTLLVGPEAVARVFVPTDDALGLGWTEAGFDDAAWATGPLGVGYDLNGGGAGDAIDSVSAYNSNVPSYAIAHGALGEFAGAYVDRVHEYRQVPEALVGADLIRTANDDKAIANFSMDVTLGGASDVYLLIDNRVGDNNGSNPPSLGPTVMPWVAAMGFVSTGLQVGLDEGANGSVNANFTAYLLAGVPAGTVLNLGAQNDGAARNMYGVAAAPTQGPSFDPFIGSNVAALMNGVSPSAYVRTEFQLDGGPVDALTLGMRYDDGFVAYLNGVEVARRNAPALPGHGSTATASRPTQDAIEVESIDITAFAHLLVAGGENVLAVHGLNAGAGDGDFLIAPTLTASAAYTGVEQFYAAPTPGAPNVGGAFGVLESVTFSTERGFYEDGFQLVLGAPDGQAVIRYTVDGSAPTATSGLVYSGPIDVDTTTVVRAAAFRPGYLESRPETHSYLFIEDVINQPESPAGWPAAWGSWPLAHYEMTPQIADDPLYHDRLLAGLRDLPTLSISMDLADFVGPQGVYSNPLQSGDAWEAVVSAELISKEGVSEFQIDAGLRVQGGASRQPENTPKHAMSLRFRGEYGAGTLEHPLMPGSAVTEFDTLQLRSVYNNSWTHWDEGQRQRTQLIHDQWARDTMIAMGNPDGGEGVFTHVYINGLYWGVYNLHERPVADHYARYFGGDKEDYDAVNGVSLNDGTWEAWDEMQAIVASKDWGAIQQVVDIDNFIDFTITQRYAGNQDLKLDGNWRAAGGGPDRAPWRFYVWDAERTLEDPNQVNNAPTTDPTGLWAHLSTIEEFAVRFADRVQLHFFNDGALTADNAGERYSDRAEEIDLAIIAESARWGSYRVDVAPRGGPGELYTRDDQWVAERDRLLEDYFPVRTQNMLNIFRSQGLFPLLDAPLFSQFGGTVDAGFGLGMTASGSAVIYYTLDGSDPRLAGGAVNTGSAVAYAGPLKLEETGRVQARALSGGVWSALVGADFTVLPQTPQLLGDYDGSLTVDAQDYQVWRIAFGAAVTPGAGADGNGDGVVDAADYSVWRDHLGATLLPPADFSFTHIGQTYTQTFDTFRGTEATLPPHFTVTVAGGVDIFRGEFDAATTAAGSFTGIMAAASDGQDYALAWRESTGAANLDDARVLFTFTNNTGEPIYGFDVSYDKETWVNGRRDNQLRFKYDVYADSDASQAAEGRNAFETDVFATPNPNHTPIAANGDQFVLDGKLPANRVTVSGYADLTTLALNAGDPGLGAFGALLPGQTAYFRWQVSNGLLTDGNRSALALDNLSITPLSAAPAVASFAQATATPAEAPAPRPAFDWVLAHWPGAGDSNAQQPARTVSPADVHLPSDGLLLLLAADRLRAGQPGVPGTPNAGLLRESAAEIDALFQSLGDTALARQGVDARFAAALDAG